MTIDIVIDEGFDELDALTPYEDLRRAAKRGSNRREGWGWGWRLVLQAHFIRRLMSEAFTPSLDASTSLTARNSKMNPELTYIVAQQRVAELHRVGQRARLATEAATERRSSRESNPITRLAVRLARLTARLAPSWP